MLTARPSVGTPMRGMPGRVGTIGMVVMVGTSGSLTFELAHLTLGTLGPILGSPGPPIGLTPGWTAGVPGLGPPGALGAIGMVGIPVSGPLGRVGIPERLGSPMRLLNLFLGTRTGSIGTPGPMAIGPLGRPGVAHAGGAPGPGIRECILFPNPPHLPYMFRTHPLQLASTAPWNPPQLLSTVRSDRRNRPIKLLPREKSGAVRKLSSNTKSRAGQTSPTTHNPKTLIPIADRHGVKT